MCFVCQLCWILCNPVDYSPPDSSVHETLQERILEWVAISFSRESSQPRNQTWIFCIADGLLEIMGIQDLSLKRNMITILVNKSGRGWEVRMESEKLYYSPLFL